MRDDNGTSGEVFQSFLKCTERVDIDIIGRLVKQQHVGFTLQGQRQMQTVALTAGEHTAFLLLVSAGEVETAQVSAGIDLTTGYTNELRTAADGLEHTLVRIDIRVLLIYITDLHRLADRERTLVGFLGTDDHAEQGRLTGSVRTDHTYDAVGRQHEIEVLEQQTVAKRLRYAFGVNDLVTQTRTVRNEDLQFLLFGLLLLVQHAVVRIQTRFLLGMTRLGCHMNPF